MNLQDTLWYISPFFYTSRSDIQMIFFFNKITLLTTLTVSFSRRTLNYLNNRSIKRRFVFYITFINWKHKWSKLVKRRIYVILHSIFVWSNNHSMSHIIKDLLNVSQLEFHPPFVIPKVDWGIEIWSLSLLLNGSKTLGEIGRPFGCAVCIKCAIASGQNADVKSDASCKESATLFARYEPLQQLFVGCVNNLLQDKIVLPIQYTLIFQWQFKFPQPSSLMASIETCSNYCELVLVLNMHEIFAAWR